MVLLSERPPLLCQSRMGGGDLNLKKDWHPAKLCNMEQVRLAEEKKKEEDKKLEVLRKEIAQEREMREIRKMEEEAGLIRKRTERLDWMYTGAVATPATPALSSRQEEYLLGRKRVDEIINGDAAPVENSFLEKRMSRSSKKDLECKIREDPMFKLRKEQMHRSLSKAESTAIRKKN